MSLQAGDERLTKLPISQEVVRVSDTWDCTICRENDLYIKRNCFGEEDVKKPILRIGKEEYYQCPLSMIDDYEIFTLINLISWSDETGIPLGKGGLMDQTYFAFVRRNIISNERMKARREIDDAKPKNTHKTPHNSSSENVRSGSRTSVLPPTRGKQPQDRKVVANALKSVSGKKN